MTASKHSLGPAEDDVTAGRKEELNSLICLPGCSFSGLQVVVCLSH